MPSGPTVSGKADADTVEAAENKWWARIQANQPDAQAQSCKANQQIYMIISSKHDTRGNCPSQVAYLSANHEIHENGIKGEHELEKRCTPDVMLATGPPAAAAAAVTVCVLVGVFALIAAEAPSASVISSESFRRTSGRAGSAITAYEVPTLVTRSGRSSDSMTVTELCHSTHMHTRKHGVNRDER